MDCFVGMVQAARSVGDPKATLKDAIAMEQAADTACRSLCLRRCFTAAR